MTTKSSPTVPTRKSDRIHELVSFIPLAKMYQLYVQTAPLYGILKELRENRLFHHNSAGDAIHIQLYPPSLQYKFLKTGLKLIFFGVHMGTALLMKRYLGPQKHQAPAAGDGVPLDQGWTKIEASAGTSKPETDKQETDKQETDKQETDKQKTSDEIFRVSPNLHQSNNQHYVGLHPPPMAIIAIGATLWNISQIFFVAVGVLLILAFHLLGGGLRPDGLVVVAIGLLLGFSITLSLATAIKYRSNIARIARLAWKKMGYGADTLAQSRRYAEARVAPTQTHEGTSVTEAQRYEDGYDAWLQQYQAKSMKDHPKLQ